MAASLADRETALASGRRFRQELETRRAELAGSAREAQQRLTDATARLHGEQARREQVESRLERLGQESGDLRRQMADLQGEMDRARVRLEEAAAQAQVLESEGGRLGERRTELGQGLEEAKARAGERQEAVHGMALQAQSLTTGVEGMVEAMARLAEQLKRQQAQREELSRALMESAQPLQELQEALQRCLARRGEMEGALRVAREETERLAERMAETDRARVSAEQEVRRLKDAHEEGRMRWQEAAVLARSLEQELEGSAMEWRAVLQDLPEEAQAEDRKAKLDRIAARIERLGAVNLAAIEEFDLQSQRKAYLDAQLADLQQAVHTLESAIRTIDRETRDRFGETFQRVNEGLQSLFPRLFGGGLAYLELTGEELLDAGVSVLARPPGKRISHIQLLSGGEKALTAVALVFALFELNPAPFCLLDEVDAPLDDANVNRFCRMVSDMSQRTQFIFVTHNKVTMELADQLTGVTMHEAGVSRLVAVDVEAAVAMAGAQGEAKGLTARSGPGVGTAGDDDQGRRAGRVHNHRGYATLDTSRSRGLVCDCRVRLGAATWRPSHGGAQTQTDGGRRRSDRRVAEAERLGLRFAQRAGDPRRGLRRYPRRRRRRGDRARRGECRDRGARRGIDGRDPDPRPV